MGGAETQITFERVKAIDHDFSGYVFGNGGVGTSLISSISNFAAQDSLAEKRERQIFCVYIEGEAASRDLDLSDTAPPAGLDKVGRFESLAGH